MPDCTDDKCMNHGVVIEKLKNMKDACKEHRGDMDKSKTFMWNAINSKMGTKMFLSLFSLIVVVVVGFMGYTTSTVRTVEKTVIRVEIQNQTILEKLNKLERAN